MIGPENDHFRLLAGERKYPFGALAEPLERIDVWGAKANLQGPGRTFSLPQPVDGDGSEMPLTDSLRLLV
jgi:hypothetical protein